MNERNTLTPGHWIAIATISVGVLGGVISVALGEHNARLGNVATTMNTIAEAQARMAEAQARMAEALARTEGELKTTQERLAGFEDRVDDRFDRIDDRFDRIDVALAFGAKGRVQAPRAGDELMELEGEQRLAASVGYTAPVLRSAEPDQGVPENRRADVLG